MPRWVAWQTQDRKGKPTKVPYSSTGTPAKADDPSTWSERQAAEVRAARLPRPYDIGGVGIMLGNHLGIAIGGIDLDSCRDPATGALEAWAAQVLERFASYAEVSPSGTGAKLLFTFDAAALPELRRAMGSEHGRQFKRRTGGDHPPAIELYLGNRYFAVTDQRLEEAPAELRPVSAETLLWLVREAGPAFAGAEASSPSRTNRGVSSTHTPGTAEPASPRSGRDGSRSGAAFRVAAQERRRGATYEQMKAALLADPETVEWTQEKGLAAGERELRRLWDRATARHGSGEAGENRPTIRVVAGDLPSVVDQAESALLKAEARLYQRGSFIVRTGRVRIAISDGRSATGLRILEVSDAALMEEMTAAATWERFDARAEDWVATDAPGRVVKAYMGRVGRWKLRVLAGIVNAPTLRPDGSILAAPGYDPATGLIFDPCGASFPTIPERPTQSDADQALGKLQELIATFPFVGEADRSVALSAILTACIRRSIPTAPMHAFTAPVPGSGKSMLVDIASVIATGREAGVIAQGKTEEETEKRLGSLLLAGEQVVAIDNCEQPLGGEFLCQMMTQPVVRTRILGRSEAPELPANGFVTATGNNLVLAGDMTRRALLARLDPQCERPELRTFDRNPIAEAKAKRGEYLVAALTVLRAYQVAGRPMRATALGSFEEWSRWVRDALLWLDCADPVETMEAARAMDPKIEALQAVMTQWREVLGTTRVSVRDLIERATRQQVAAGTGTLHAPKFEFVHPDLREALLNVAGDGGVINSRRLSKWVTAHQDRVVEGRCITRLAMVDGFQTYRLQTMPTGSQP